MKSQIFISRTTPELPMCALLVIVALLTAGEAMATQLITNGGFEFPVGTYSTITNLPGWYVSDSVDVQSHSQGGWPAYEGDQSIDLSGCATNGAYIEQAFVTSPGRLYQLSFHYANNIWEGQECRARVRLMGSTIQVDELLRHSGSTQTAMNYTAFQTNVMADSSMTTLRFTHIFPPSSQCQGIVLDAVSVSDNTQDTLTNGLVAYYPLNGNANDASGNGNDLTVLGGVTFVDGGIAGKAAVFNGTDGSLERVGPTILNQVPLTVCAWVNASMRTLEPIGGYFGGVSYPNNVISDDNPGVTGHGFGLNIISNASFLTVECHDPLGGLHQLSGPFFADAWYHLAVIYTTGNCSIFVNGILWTNVVFQEASLAGVNTIRIGRHNDRIEWGARRFFKGMVDDVRIYNRALSDSEVQQLYAYGATPCSPYRATAIATLVNGFVVGAAISTPGCGYTNTPLVRFIGGGGSGAQAVAVVSNGVIAAINVLDAGFGYTNAPLVLIEPPFIPSPVLGIAPMSFLSFSNLTVGGAYQLQQSVAWFWSNQPVSFAATNTVYTQMVAGVANSGSYRLALNPVPAQAFATPQVVNGFVVGAAVTSGGSGYVTPPAVTIAADGGGTNATAVSQISGGVVTNITITDAGIGYTNTPTVEIAPPPAAAVSPTVLPVMRVDSTNLSPYDNYQVQFKPDIARVWANWIGGLFSPTDVTNSQYLFITNGVGFFRLQYVP
jgi:hypothetical protein